MGKKEYKFNSPDSIDECVNRRRSLLDSIRDISEQLTGDGRVDPKTGAALTQQEYRVWRRRASTAWKLKRAEYRYLKRFQMDLTEKECSFLTLAYHEFIAAGPPVSDSILVQEIGKFLGIIPREG